MAWQAGEGAGAGRPRGSRVRAKNVSTPLNGTVDRSVLYGKLWTAVAAYHENVRVVRRYLPKVSSLRWEFTTVDLPGAEDKVLGKHRLPHSRPLAHTN